MPLAVNPFDSRRLIGTLTEVTPTSAKLNLPNAAQAEGQWLHGRRLGGGEVGEFVLIENGDRAILGRIVSVKLPEKERLSVEEDLGTQRESHPLGTIQLLVTIILSQGKVVGGITQYPRLGSRVFSAHPELIKWVSEASQRTSSGADPVAIEFASIPLASDTVVSLTPERLFGRHCAVLGATGGGKSWTLARLIEQCAKYHAKLLLIDASGEFHTLDEHVLHYQIGEGTPEPPATKEATLPYKELKEDDLFAIFRPSGGVQHPKLRAAIKSLKLVAVLGAASPLVKNGMIVKANQPKAPIEAAQIAHAVAIQSTTVELDIDKLVGQIQNECTYPAADYGKDQTKYGDTTQNDVSNCVGLLSRIEGAITSAELSCIFKPGKKPSITKVISDFLGDDKYRVLRISLRYLPSSLNAPEIVANAIGRYLLATAKAGKFLKGPVILFVDEAHQFLNKVLGDENQPYPLDSFEIIAKEGRKHSLSLCLSTQRPRDIPEGILSQMGTLIVHRLINDKDREVVERASGDIDRSAAAFLPTLVPGEAVVIGSDFAIPLVISISEPLAKPVSKGPDFQGSWRPKPKGKPK
jgi:ethanolamine utilization microcompartment shell protein EutS